MRINRMSEFMGVRLLEVYGINQHTIIGHPFCIIFLMMW